MKSSLYMINNRLMNEVDNMKDKFNIGKKIAELSTKSILTNDDSN